MTQQLELEDAAFDREVKRRLRKAALNRGHSTAWEKSARHLVGEQIQSAIKREAMKK